MIHMGMIQERIVFKERCSLFPSMATAQLGRRQFYLIIFLLMLSKGVIQQSLLFPLRGGIDIELKDSFSMSLL